MNQSRGILYLADPIGGTAQMHMQDVQTLIFNENERYLYQAQRALYQARRHFEWICVAADGAADVALSLAAQLAPDRIAIHSGTAGRNKPSRELAWLRAFARRNLALIASEVLLIGPDDAQLKWIQRGIGHNRICVLEDMPFSACHFLLTAPWEALREKNLLNPGKCV